MKLKKPLIFETAFSKFTASEILGEGGSGRVFRAVDELGTYFAIKLLDSNKATSEKRKRFENEAFFCLKRCHSNVIKVIDHGLFIETETKSPFYVMPCYAKSLRVLMQEGVSSDKALVYFSQILDGVEAAHLQKVIHRDLKPENILYNQTEDQLLIADFGIAHFEQEDLYTAVETGSSSHLANFQYAAPEQRTRGSLVDQRADIYSLGLMLNEMFTGAIPLGTNYKKISVIAPKYSYLDDLIDEMLRQLPGERPSSIDNIKQQLIARQNEFVTRQRISELKQTVVPVSEIDDPLIADPPNLVRADWNKGVLTLYLQQSVNEKWIRALKNMGDHTSVWGKGPENFGFSDNKAIINVGENDVQRVIDYFKTWLPKANRKYELTLREEKQREEQRQRAELQQKIQDEEQRQRVLKNIKI